VADFISMLVGSQFMNPAWEWATFGIVTQQMPVLLIASAFILAGGRHNRGNKERRLMQLFYWWLLASGIAYLLLVPLAASNLFRLTGNLDKALEQQLEQVDQQTALARTRLDQATSDPAVAGMVAPGLTGDAMAERLAQLGTRLGEENQMMRNRATTGYQQERQKLLKQAITWFSQGLIAAVALLLLWQHSGWIRQCKPIADQKAVSRERPGLLATMLANRRRRPVKPKKPPKPPLRVRLFGDSRKPVKPARKPRR
jgi:uncharacterized membrane protein